MQESRFEFEPAREREISTATIRITGSESQVVQEILVKSADFALTPTVPTGRISGSIVQHWMFKHGITCVVVLGAIQMGFEADLQSPEFKRAWYIWDVCYTVISTLEMICMIESYRSVYFTTGWMVLDFVLAVASIISTFVLPAAKLPRDSILRNVRLLRILRIIKVTKVFHGFAVIVDGLKDSFRSMFWIFALLLIILYAAGIFCVDVLGRQDAGFLGYSEAEDQHTLNNFIFFGTLLRSMLTLLGMLLLSEWALIRDIAEVHAFMVPFFLLLLVLVTFGVLNVIIGIVVEKTIAAMQKPHHDEQLRDASRKAALSQEIAELFDHIDSGRDGGASLRELEQALTKNPKFALKLENLDLPYNFTVFEFLGMLDSDGNGVLSKNEFVSGLLRLILSNDWQRECLHAMEIGMLRQTVQRIGKDLKQELIRRVDALQSDVRDVMVSHVAPVQTETFRCHHSPGTLSGKIPCGNDVSSDVGAQPLQDQWEPVPDSIFVTVGDSHCSASQRDRGKNTIKVDMIKVKRPRVAIDPTFDTVSLETETRAQFTHFTHLAVHGRADGDGCRALIDRDDVTARCAEATQRANVSSKSTLSSYEKAGTHSTSMEHREFGNNVARC